MGYTLIELNFLRTTVTELIEEMFQEEMQGQRSRALGPEGYRWEHFPRTLNIATRMVSAHSLPITRRRRELASSC